MLHNLIRMCEILICLVVTRQLSSLFEMLEALLTAANGKEAKILTRFELAARFVTPRNISVCSGSRRPAFH